MDEQADIIRVYTLGRFHVSRGDNQILEVGAVMNKTWSVFKFLLTHRHTPVPGELICEAFWAGVPLEKARHSLYNVIYRLRLLFDDGNQGDDIFRIRDGLFSMKPDARLWVDVDEFQELCTEAYRFADKDDTQVMELLDRALDLYRGDYLAENYYDDWLKSAQERYRSLYCKAVLQYLDVLIERQEFLKACEMAERALTIEPLNEDIQLRRVSVLSDMGNLQEAKDAYQSFAALLQSESGVTPRRDLRNLYREIQTLSGNPAVADIEQIEEFLDDQASDDPLVCDGDVFGQLYQLERKRLERERGPSFLVRVNLTKEDMMRPSGPELELAAKHAAKVFSQVLRKGDVICSWNDEQFLLLLPNIENADLPKVTRRVTRQFRSSYPGKVVLRMEERELQSESSSLHSAR